MAQKKTGFDFAINQNRLVPFFMTLTYLFLALLAVIWLMHFFRNRAAYPLNGIGAIWLGIISCFLLFPIAAFLVFKFRAKLRVLSSLEYSSFFGLMIIAAFIGIIIEGSMTQLKYGTNSFVYYLIGNALLFVALLCILIWKWQKQEKVPRFIWGFFIFVGLFFPLVLVLLMLYLLIEAWLQKENFKLNVLDIVEKRIAVQSMPGSNIREAFFAIGAITSLIGMLITINSRYFGIGVWFFGLSMCIAALYQTFGDESSKSKLASIIIKTIISLGLLYIISLPFTVLAPIN